MYETKYGVRCSTREDLIHPIESILEPPVDTIGAYRMIICDNIGYDVLCSQYDKACSCWFSRARIYSVS